MAIDVGPDPGPGRGLDRQEREIFLGRHLDLDRNIDSYDTNHPFTPRD